MSNSGFLEHIDLIFKIFTNSFDESSGDLGARFPNKSKEIVDVRDFKIPQIIFSKKDSGFSLELFGVSWVPKDSHGHVR